MCMKRIITLFRKKQLPSSFLVFPLATIGSSVIVGLSLGFGGRREWFDHFFLPLWMDFMPLMIGVAATWGFGEALRWEKNEGMAEMLFSTPVTAMEYMFSLWLKGVVIGVLVTYLAMGAFALSLGIERVAAHVSPHVWLQPPLLIITLVSGSGLALSILLSDGSSIKRIFHLVIVFAPIAIVTTLVGIMFFTMFIGIRDLPDLPTWISWSLETLQTVAEITPTFIYSPWARWLATSVYMLAWFFVWSRKMHIGKFIRPFPGWRSAFVPW